MIIDFGLATNLATVGVDILGHLIKKDEYVVTYTFLNLATWVANMSQFVLLVLKRYSHTGSVCSGDYKDYVYAASNSTLIDNKYEQFFLDSEGSFFFWFSFLIFLIVGLVVGVGTLVMAGTMIFGAIESLGNIEEFVKKMDSVQDIMKN